MLQLIDPELSREVHLLKDVLKHAQMLMRILTDEPSRINDNPFTMAIVAIRGQVPLFDAAQKATKTKKRTSAIPEDERVELRKALRIDIDALISDAKHYDLEPKLFDDKVLNGCPNAALLEMEEKKRVEIKQLQKELDEILDARHTVGAIQMLWQQAETLEATLDGRAAKRQRND